MSALAGGLTRGSRFGLAVAAVAIAAATIATWLFPRALPMVSLKQSLTRGSARASADSFFRAHALAPPGARSAVRFQGNDSLSVFVELAGGGADSLKALVRGRDVAPFTWSVRAFVPRDAHEARVHFAPDGRIIGFSRTLAEADRRPTVTADSGQRLAELALGTWVNDRVDRWRLASSSYETRKSSARVDRSYIYERTDRRVGSAPIRAEVVIAGDVPARVRQYVEIPESFQRRYGEMRSANDLLALIASLGALAIAVAGVGFLARNTRDVRWREAMVVGAVIGVLTLAASLNEMGSGWYEYDTAMSPSTFQARIAMTAVLGAVVTALLAGFTLAAAEAATRRAFPRQLDWWQLWRYRGTREVAARVAGGYAVAAIGFAYVAVFYLVTRSLLGWWVPSEMLDDPNLIATPVPWMSGIAVSLNAGVWEESLFRALPLALLSLWVGQRASRRWWMAGGVVATALVFGFAHANYASWPPYSRGVEIFVDACFWGVLVLTAGLLVTVVAHFVYDLVLFGLFAAAGSAPEYRISAAITLLALLAPALAVAWRWARQGTLAAAPDDARFAAWVPGAAAQVVAPPAPEPSRGMTPRSRRLALVAVVAGTIAAVAVPPAPTLGPRFTADRPRALAVADSLLRARGGNPAGWRRLATTATDTLAAWPRFLRAQKLVAQAQRFAATYLPPAWWVVRYVHTTGTAAQRTEEWRVRVWPDGRPLDARHILPDSAPRRATAPEAVPAIALAALAREGVHTATLQESDRTEKALPARRDVTVTFTDTAARLPAGAAAKAWVHIAGDEPLVARRGIELPEAFLRADRERQTSRAVIAGLCGVLLAIGVVIGGIMVTRRRPAVLDDGTLDRRQTFMVLGGLATLSVLGNLNSLPTALFAWDTTEPWGRFIGTTTLALAAALPGSLAVLGLWLALGALRRRVGIPMLAGPAPRSASRDMVLAGLGLGGLLAAARALGALLPARGVPRPPSTLLTDAVPALSGLAELPAQTMAGIALVGIPILVVAGITRKPALRALIVLTMLALFAALVRVAAPAAAVDPARLLLLAATLALAALALGEWGTRGAWSWVVAALALQGLGGAHDAVHAPAGQERVAGALLLTACGVLVVMLARRVRSADPMT